MGQSHYKELKECLRRIRRSQHLYLIWPQSMQGQQEETRYLGYYNMDETVFANFRNEFVTEDEWHLDGKVLCESGRRLARAQEVAAAQGSP